MGAFPKLLAGAGVLLAASGGYVEFFRNQTNACISPDSMLRDRACNKAIAQGGQPPVTQALVHSARVRIRTIYGTTSLDDARKAVELDPASHANQVLLARVLEAKRQYDEAAVPLFKALAERPDDREAQSVAYSLCRSDGTSVQPDIRLRACTSVIESQQRSTLSRSAHTMTRVLRERMRLRYAQGDGNGAEADARLLLQEASNDREALVMLGQTAMKRGHRDEAITAFENALRQKADGSENDRKALAVAQAAIAQALTPVTIRTGVTSRRRPGREVAPLAITASPQASVLIKVFELGSQTPELVAFIRAGETLTTKMHLGIFEIKVASGETWYGDKRLFGPATRYSKLASTFEFSTTPTGYNGNRIELVTQRGGNLAQHTIDPTNF